MGRAEDLLNSLQDTDTNNEISLLIAGENTDTEPHFVISDNRIISVPSELRTIAVQYDHNIETVTFDCPRYWDGHDMSKMVVYINYERADGETGAYLAENVRVDDEDDSIMHFEWTISRNVTSASGSVTFLVCIKSVDESGKEQEHWNSERCSDISVAPGLETGEPIEEEYPDVLTQLSEKVDDISKSNVKINDEQASSTSTYSSSKINSLVSGKADQSELDTLEGTVSQLSTSLDTLETTVEGKANQTDLTALQTTVNSKADSSTVTELSSKVGSLETTVGTKADTSTVNQQISSLQTEFSNDISELDSALDQTNAQVALKTSINDSQSATGTTYSSSKIEQLVNNVQTGLATDISELEESVTGLSGDLTVLETKVDDLPAINDSTASTTSLYSSQKIENLMDAVLPSGGEDGNVLIKNSQGEIWGKVIDDAQPSSTTTTLSASGITQALDTLEVKVDGKPNINDTASSTTSVYSSDKVDDLLNEISTSSGSVPPGGTAGQVLRKSTDNATTEWSTIIDDDASSSTNSAFSASYLTNALSKKAAQTDLDGLKATVGTKADTATVTELSSKVGSLESTINSKADQTQVDTLEETVSTLQTTVGAKADQTDLDLLETKVDGKPSINDSQTTANNTWSSQKIQNKINLGDYEIIGFNRNGEITPIDDNTFSCNFDILFKDGDFVIFLPKPYGDTNDIKRIRHLVELGGFIPLGITGEKTAKFYCPKSPSVSAPLLGGFIFRKKGA